MIGLTHQLHRLAGAVELMKAYGVDVAGKHALVVGRSPIVGRS